MTQFWLLVGVPVIISLAVNEASDVAPWLARRLIRRAADLWAAGDLDQATILREEWAALIEDCPGKLTKLLVATRFAAGAMAKAESHRAGRIFGRLRQLGQELWSRRQRALPMAWLLAGMAAGVANAFLSSGLTITNSAGMLINGAAMAIWLIRRTPAAARLVERKVRSALLTEVAAVQDCGLLQHKEMWVHSVGDAFVIVHYQGGHDLANALFWDPRRRSFVPFVQLGQIPEIGNRYWPFLATDFRAIRYRTLAEYVTQRP